MNIVAITNIDIQWNQYLLIMKQVLGRSISRGVDSSGNKICNDEYGLKSYLLTLAEFKYPDSDARNILKDGANEFLKHLHFGFIIIDNDPTFFPELVMISNNQLSITLNDRVAIVSATLEQWRTAIINGSTGDENRKMLEFFNGILNYFESIGFSQLWFHYKKYYLPDRTYLLENK